MSGAIYKKGGAIRICVGLVMVVVSVIAPRTIASTAVPRSDYIVTLNNWVPDPEAVADSQVGTPQLIKQVYRHTLKGYTASLTTAQAASLSSDPRVDTVELDQEFHIAADTQIVTHSVERIGGPESSTVSGDGHGSVRVNVAVLDTGIDASHPELHVAGGVNCDPQAGDPLTDPLGHGTMVSGLIGARDNRQGIVGVAPNARLWSVRVVGDKGRGPNSSIICGLDWAAGTHQDSDRSNNIAVANISLGGLKKPSADTCASRHESAVLRATCGATAAGVTIVAAAGNGPVPIEDDKPAGYPDVLTATGMTDTDGQPGGLGSPPSCLPGGADDTPDSSSNFATTPTAEAHTVAAPAVCVTSTYPGGGYAVGTGTSFAAPLVSGTVALCIASGHCAGLTPMQIIAKITGDANAYAAANPENGFQGDPEHPIAGKYYGPLIRAALY